MQKVWCSLPSAWTVIDSETLAAPASSVSFTGISDTYRMFRMTAYIVKDGTSGVAYVRVNNDSGGNYDRQTIGASSTTVSAARSTGDTEWRATVASITGNTHATTSIVVAKQLAASPAMYLAETTYAPSGGVQPGRLAGRWNNTDALINRIDLISGSGNFAAGTTVVLEGM